MCGIAGLLNCKNIPAEETRIRRMTDCMAHRGPDADGFFLEGNVALGHRRLSIIDLSSSANQPFFDNSGRFVMVYNGEIYNYKAVKQLLPEYAFRTTGDTEMVIAAYAKWGPDCLFHFRGMFSLAIWDKRERELFLARDRSGVKPLYYYRDENHVVFASEQRAVLASGLVNRRLNHAALCDYFQYQSVASPHSAIQGIRQLEAGTWMKIKDGETVNHTYWDVAGLPGLSMPGDRPSVLKKVRELMLQSVERRLVSDVPVGAFLSGGIDSSAIVGLMAETGSDKPNTFTVAFEEKEFDESSYADIIVKKFSTHHTRISLRPDDFLSELENALDSMDSPSGDGVNTFVVSKAIRNNGMAVALSGVGGDELFAGYPYFRQFLQLQHKRWLWQLPTPLRRASAALLPSSQERIRQLLRADSPSIEYAYPVFRQIVAPSTLERLLSLDGSPNGDSLAAGLFSKREALHRLPLLSQVTAAEYLGYTQHTLLKDTDQMSMAVSLEVREPFFDQDLIEFLLSVPDDLKSTAIPKGLLVESLGSLLPDEIVYRKKQGFLFPWKLWLKSELREFCDRRIRNLARRPFVHGRQLEEFWRRFLKGDKSIRWTEIWLFVVLEHWMEKNSIE
jgi:asparagine synthase (glutamine-hydrolysing)